MADPHSRLIRHLLAQSDGTGVLVEAACRPWHSVTFSGSQHRLRLALPPAAAEWLSDHLAELDFAIPGHVVADIVLVDCRMKKEAIELVIEALTIEEG